MRTPIIKWVLAIALIAGLAGIGLWYFAPGREVKPPVVQSPMPKAAAPAPVPVELPAPPAGPVVAAPAAEPAPAGQTEIAATRRMYLAHAPLRAPEVANPDSETNRRILQTMVTKALARTPSGTPPAEAAQPATLK